MSKKIRVYFGRIQRKRSQITKKKISVHSSLDKQYWQVLRNYRAL